jgi:hypothetical protein
MISSHKLWQLNHEASHILSVQNCNHDYTHFIPLQCVNKGHFIKPAFNVLSFVEDNRI